MLKPSPRMSIPDHIARKVCKYADRSRDVGTSGGGGGGERKRRQTTRRKTDGGNMTEFVKKIRKTGKGEAERGSLRMKGRERKKEQKDRGSNLSSSLERCDHTE